MVFAVNSVNQMIFVMVKCCVPFEVWAAFLNITYMSIGFEGLKASHACSNLLVCLNFDSSDRLLLDIGCGQSHFYGSTNAQIRELKC
jgi:hypothetical protein